MSNITAMPRSVANALEDVARWKSDVAQKSRKELTEVDQEIENIKTAMANLQKQLEALQVNRVDIAAKADSASGEEGSKAYNAVFSTMAEQMESLRARAQAIAAAEATRNAALNDALRDPAVAALMTEYAQFKASVEPTLAALPESYRGVILAHHQGVSEKLRTSLEKANGTVTPIDGPLLQVDAVFAVDAPEGSPEVLMFVLPVHEQVGTEWAQRADDAQSWLTARVTQGLYAAFQGAGLAQARIAVGGHQGLLVGEVEVGGAPKDLNSRVRQALINAFVGAKELADAKIMVNPQEVPFENLLPPEEEG